MISIVIPNYNGEKILEKNIPRVLDSVKDYKGSDVELIIADDFSTDNSLSIIRDIIKKNQTAIKIFVVENKKNKGFSSNVNSGVKIARGDIIVLLNSDVIPHIGFIKTLLPHFSDSDVFAVGCLDESIEGEKTVLRGIGKAKWHKGFFIHSEGDINSKITLWASGGSSAFRKSIWDKLGGLQEIYNPFYWEDIDLSYRAWKSGYKVIFEKKSIVRHEHEKGSIKTQMSPSKISSVSYRNQFLFVWLNITDSNLILSHLIWVPLHILTAVVNKNTSFLKGFVAAIFRIPLCFRIRKASLSKFTKTDYDILQKFR